VKQASAVAVNYQGGQNIENRDVYLSMINGLTYGDSENQGFVRGDNFYHTKMGFTFAVPRGFNVQNNPNEVIATNSSGSVIILDAGRDDQGRDPLSYITQNWMKANPPQGAEAITINGMKAATAAFAGSVSGKAVTIRVVAIEWKPSQFFRFQMAIPQNAGTDVVEAMKRTTYSFRPMTDGERAGIKPLKVRTFTAGAGNTVASAASRMGFSDYKEDRFRVLNAVSGASLTPGQVYKVIAE
jgi:predicted Zn-dependent protease